MDEFEVQSVDDPSELLQKLVEVGLILAISEEDADTVKKGL